MAPATRVGGVVSFTVNVLLHIVMLPAVSLTVTVMVVLPRPTIVPAVGLWEIINEPSGVQLSWATTEPVILGTAAMQVGPAEAGGRTGHMTLLGASLSTTVTVKLHIAELPQAFVVLQVT